MNEFQSTTSLSQHLFFLHSPYSSSSNFVSLLCTILNSANLSLKEAVLCLMFINRVQHCKNIMQGPPRIAPFLSTSILSTSLACSSLTIQRLQRKMLMEWIRLFRNRWISTEWRSPLQLILSRQKSVVYVSDSGLVIFGQFLSFKISIAMCYNFWIQNLGSNFSFKKLAQDFWLQKVGPVTIGNLEVKELNRRDHTITTSINRNTCGDKHLPYLTLCSGSVTFRLISRCST